MKALTSRHLLLVIAAPIIAVIVAFLITSAILASLGDPVGRVWETIFSTPSASQIVDIINGATIYYLSAIAVAVGFQMKLFNIGVDGQYRVAAFVGALFAGQAWFPGPVNVILTILVAMVAGGLWASIAAYLRVTRGVHEVISTIMLNSIATYLVGYFLRKVAVRQEGSNAITTQPIPESSRLGGLAIIPGSRNEIYILIVIAIIVGIGYWFVVNRTRFGFDMRAAGASKTAAEASGVKVKRMVFLSLVISGALAGLVGMPLLFGQDYSYGTTFQSGLGFAGIGIALLGRNNAVGIAFAALLWAFLEQQANGLQIFADVAPELVYIIQGVILFAVVIAYEVVRRIDLRMEQVRVARDLGGGRPDRTIEEGAPL